MSRICVFTGAQCSWNCLEPHCEVGSMVDKANTQTPDPVNHPAHYGGADDPYEAIKVIEAWGLGFNLGNTAKYISRAERKGAPVEDLKKALWYLQREISKRELKDEAKQTESAA